MNFSAVILAGGQSRRMGRDKTWMEFDGQPLIARAVNLVRKMGVAEILISGRVGQDYSALHCPVLFDLKPGSGPLGGIERALEVIREPLLLVLAMDLPLLTARVLKELAARCHPRCGVVPRVAGRTEPLAAFYPKAAHAALLEVLARGVNHASRFAELCVSMGLARYYDVTSSRYFANWNTPQDVSASTKFSRMAARKHSKSLSPRTGSMKSWHTSAQPLMISQ